VDVGRGQEEAAADQAGDALMARLAARDRTALAPLYLRCSPLAKRALLRFAPECATSDLEDLLQDVFVALFEGAPRYPAGVGVERWIWGIAANTARHWRRKTWVRRKLLGRQGDPSMGMARRSETSPETAVALRRAIKRAIDALPEEQRDVLVLDAAEGFSGEEIAGILGIRHETVRTRLFRARRRLLELVPDQLLPGGAEGSAR